MILDHESSVSSSAKWAQCLLQRRYIELYNIAQPKPGINMRRTLIFISFLCFFSDIISKLKVPLSQTAKKCVSLLVAYLAAHWTHGQSFRI